MIELYINGNLCDINKGTSIAINKAVTDGIDKVKGGWTKSFKLPATPTNRNILNYVEILQSENGIDKNTLAEAILRNGIEILKGKALVESITINDTDYYEINIISGNKSWVAEIGEKTFADLDFSDGDFVYDKDMIISIGDVIMPLINFGELKNHNGILDFDNFRPAYKVGWILQKAFGLTSYGVEYPALFDKLVIPHTAKFSMTDEDRNNLYAKLYRDDTSTLYFSDHSAATVQKLTFNYTVSDAGSHIISSEYHSDFTGYLRVHLAAIFKVYGTNYTNTTGTVEIGWISEDGVYYQFGTMNYDGGYTNANAPESDITNTKDVYVESGKYYYLYVKLTDNGSNSAQKITFNFYGSTAEIERIEKYYYGETVHLNDIMPEWSIKNLIKGLDQLFNLIFDIDEETNKIKIEFEDDYYESGSIRTLTPLKSDIKMNWYDTAKETVFGYKKDTNDYAVNRLEIDGRCIFDKTFDFQNKYTDRKEEKRNAFFAPTIMTHDGHIADLPNIDTPYMKKSETAGFESDGYQPRLLYSDGLQNISGGYYIYTYPQNYLMSSFNLCYSYYDPSNVLYPPNDYPINLSFNDKAGIEGLLSKYHKNKLKRLDIGRKIELTVKITLADFNDWNFRDTFKIDIPDWHEINGYYHLLEIKDFNPNKETVNILLVQAFKTSEEYTPPRTLDDTDEINTRSADNGVTYSSGEMVVLKDGIEVASVSKTGLTSKYDDLFYVERNEIKPLYYINQGKLTKLKA